MGTLLDCLLLVNDWIMTSSPLVVKFSFFRLCDVN